MHRSGEISYPLLIRLANWKNAEWHAVSSVPLYLLYSLTPHKLMLCSFLGIVNRYGKQVKCRLDCANFDGGETMSEQPKTIIVVDDEPRMVRFVKMNLDLEGYRALEANDGFQALEKVREYQPALVLLDVEMPGLDGFETLKRLREISDTPVIMLTVRSDEDDRIKGLDLGADDYVTKPFSPRELSSRIRAVLRRFEQTNSRPEDQIIRIDERLQVDMQRRDVIVNGERQSLRPTEYRLLQQLIDNAGWVVPHEVLLTKAWGHEYSNDNHLLRLYITYLRKKIEEDPGSPRYIFTERGLGYRFVDYMGHSSKR